MSLTLVIGGTRSGKSARAEELARRAGGAVRYVATADAEDDSMRERIAGHRDRRPPEWETVVAADDLAATVAPGATTLLDGLGTWIAGMLARGEGAAVPDALERLAAAAREHDLIVVAEEAGQGMLPMDSRSRAWLDLLGESVQRLAGAAAHVELVVAGRPLPLLSRAPAGRGAAAPPNEHEELRRHGDRELLPGFADHAVNVMDPGPPSWLLPALRDALERRAGGYPDEAPACEAIAAWHGRSADEVVVTNGAAEALWLLGPALRPALAACLHPAFTEAEAALRAHGHPVTRVQRLPGDGFSIDPEAVPRGAELVIVGNPASPSGTLAPACSLLALRAPGRVLAVDEAFMSMVPGEPASLAGERLGGVIVIRSLTKLLSVAGLRVGYALAPPPLARALRAVRPPWSANALALAALVEAYSQPARLAELAERATAERMDLERLLDPIDGLRTWPSAANFILAEVADGPAVLAALRARRIAVRPAASFPGLDERHLRLTARDPERNERLAQALAEALR